MEREERQRLKSATEDVNGWTKRATKLVKERQHVTDDRARAAEALATRLLPRGGWRTLNLTPGDGDLVTAMARGNLMPRYSADVTRAIDVLTGDGVVRAMHDAKSVLGARRVLSRKDKVDVGARAAEWVATFHAWIVASGVLAELEHLEAWDKKSVFPLGSSSS